MLDPAMSDITVSRPTTQGHAVHALMGRDVGPHLGQEFHFLSVGLKLQILNLGRRIVECSPPSLDYQ